MALERSQAGESCILGGEVLTFPEIWTVVAEVLGRRPPGRQVSLGLLRALSQVSRTFGSALFPANFLDMNWRQGDSGTGTVHHPVRAAR